MVHRAGQFYVTYTSVSSNNFTTHAHTCTPNSSKYLLVLSDCFSYSCFVIVTLTTVMVFVAFVAIVVNALC